MFVQQRDGGGIRLVTSASDLTAASACEFAFLRRVDRRFGRDVDVPPDDDPMLARAARLGDAHEERVLQAYREAYGPAVPGSAGGVAEIPRPASMAEEDLAALEAATRSALQDGADVVFQATFFDPTQRASDPETGDPEIGFIGFADFLQRTSDGTTEVQDTKLARKARVTALMQLAAYAEQLERIGTPVSAEATLILGDGARSHHRIADIAPVFRARRSRLHALLLERARSVGPDGSREGGRPIAWGAEGVRACGRCEVCAPEVERTRDPLLIAGIRATQREALLAAGLTTIDAVAAASGTPVLGLSAPVLERVIGQAAVQVAAEPGGPPPVQVTEAAALAAIPAPDEGDLFFDFEGDPMYREPDAGVGARWGLDYLFGMVDPQDRFTPIWAHTLEAEREALLEFLRLVRARRARYPSMHIYHYAAYERSHLLSIAARHGVGEAEVDELLREHVLVDLYPIVRRALRIGSRSYSIKRLEPLYMGDELRDTDGVTSGAQSVTEYAEATAQLRSGDPDERAEGERRLAAIADYNRYDCVATRRLRDWLRSIAATHRVEPYPAGLAAEDAAPALELSATARRLQAHAADRPEVPEQRSVAALAASAIDYHQREQKAFWWAHFARLVDPIEDWADTRDVLVVDPERSAVEEPWFRPPRARVDRRHLRLRGDLAPGSSLRPGSDAYLLYEFPAPFAQLGGAPGARAARRVRILERADASAGGAGGAGGAASAGGADRGPAAGDRTAAGDSVLVEESLANGAAPFAALPVALVPGPPPPAGAQRTAIEEWGSDLAGALDLGRFPDDPVVDLIRRRPPRLVAGGRPIDTEAADLVDAVTATVSSLDRSTLAVQGPPGTGKTYLAARVIRRLVEERGWVIGVVAQSHRVVENVLAGAVSAGLDARRVGKVPQGGALDPAAPPPVFTALPKNGHARFVEEHRARGRGCVIGGTAWDFSNPTRFARRSLDLLVVDEAGQFSLAPTIAASVAAERLLLLGDPQQLPQVSQGAHPEPVDTSALGWLLGAHETMPVELGYFLAETRRMRPELADVVSELAYEGRLHAHPDALERHVSGAGLPGLHWHPVDHRGNATSSPEEAAEVVRLVREALRGRLSEPGAESGAESGAAPRSLDESDVIVVAPYNAQVECVSAALAASGLTRVRVGTVDKFQGQEAVIAIVTLAASSADDVPRGLEFLLMRNRLNVAISRAQWAAHLVSSSRLGDGLPSSAEGLEALSGYLRLTERGGTDPDAASPGRETLH